MFYFYLSGYIMYSWYISVFYTELVLKHGLFPMIIRVKAGFIGFIVSIAVSILIALLAKWTASLWPFIFIGQVIFKKTTIKSLLEIIKI